MMSDNQKSHSNWRGSVILTRIASLIFLACVAIQGACSRSERPAIGDSFDSPIALASHPSLAVSYALSASLGGEYETGSLQALSVPSSGALQRLATVETPRLGTALAVAKSGQFLMAAFSGSAATLRVFALDAAGMPTDSLAATDQLTLPTGGRIGSLSLVQMPDQTDWTVLISQADRTYDSRVFIYRYSTSAGFTLLLQSSADFYSPQRDNPLGAYSLAWGAPVVFPSLGIVVAFPQGSLGYLGQNPSALDWLSGKVSVPNAQSDLRTVSALVVDLNRLMSGTNKANSIGFAPISFNAAGQLGDATADSSATANQSFTFRQFYQSAVAIDSQGSPCIPNSPVAALAAHTAVVATNTDSADVIALGGFDVAANQLRTRLAQGDVQPLLGNVLVPAPVSLASSQPDLVGIRTLIPQFNFINTGTLCTLTWLRVEQQRSSLGFEQSRVQVVTDAAAVNQAQLASPLRGMAGFTVIGSSILASSFNTNQIQRIQFNGTALQAQEVFP